MLNAIFFDFNGVIINDELLHYKALKEILKKEKIFITKKDYYKYYLALDDRTSIRFAFKNKISSKKLFKLAKEKSEIYKKILKKEKIKWFPGAIELIKKLSKKYYIGIVSGAIRREIEYILKKGKILDYFDVIVSAEDTANTKPAPEGFLLALKLLNKKNNMNIKPQECLAIEDSTYGIIAAKTAGMKCVAVTNSYPKHMLKKADLVINSLKKFEIDHFHLEKKCM